MKIKWICEVCEEIIEIDYNPKDKKNRWTINKIMKRMLRQHKKISPNCHEFSKGSCILLLK
ncbi:MAG: hypothetical protein ABIH51_00770 [Patescibacteria group bacterium]